jgi:hypothetical protein
MRLYRHAATALVLAALMPAASVAQLKPVVATFTVPLTITNMDDEALHKVIGDLHVQCSVFAVSGPAALARGSTKVDLVITPATPTTRATANFSGNVVVVTYARSGGNTGGLGSAGFDPEKADQAAAQKAIDDAAKYRCDLMSATAVLRGVSAGDLNLATLTAKGMGKAGIPIDPVTTFVEGALGGKK